MKLSALIKNDRRGNKVIQNALEAGTPIQQGTRATAVKWLERMLKLNGYDIGKQDNAFTSKTKAALESFQRAWGLPVTGSLDKATFKKLEHTQTRIRNTQKHQKGCPDCTSPKVDSFGIGQKSNQVLVAEKRLKRLGYDVGKIDGVFDKQLHGAVIAFRKDQKELPDSAGVLSQRALESVRRESARLSHTPYQVRALKNHKSRKRLDALTATRAQQKNEEGHRGFGVGAVGRHVKNVQARLRAAGFDPTHVNGRFDERTEAALKAFQRQSGLPATGVVTPYTWKKLAKTYIYAKNSFTPGQMEGEKSAAVLRSERLLRKLGYKRVKVDGHFDANTESAVKAFEKKYDLKRDGIITQRDYNKMKKVLEARQSRVDWGKGWGGSEGMADAAKKIARDMGIPVTSTKRSAAASIGSSTGSDHHVSQKNAYAVDFGVYGSRGTALAKRIARTYGLKPPYIGTYKNHYVRVDGRTYRVQLLWQVAGHYDHVHVGFRRVG